MDVKTCGFARLTQNVSCKKYRRALMKIVLSLLFILLPTIAFSATEVVVLNGIPIVQSKGNIQQSENLKLSEIQQNEYRLLITKKGDDYFWTTRENRPLIKMQSGDISIFIEPGGAGYIRVSEQNGQVLYLEHMANGFQTITYWGTAKKFKP